jgi:hypothetical protein
MRQRSAESEVLLLCARQHVTESAAERVARLCGTDSFRWPALFRATVEHQIACLVLTNLHKIDGVGPLLPKAVGRQWKSFQIRSILGRKNRERTIGQVVEFLRGRDARVMLVKGAALDAVVYDQPWYIQSDDVDMLVDRPWFDFARPDRVALKEFLRGKHVELECQRHHDLDMNEVLDVDYARLWADARPVQLACGQVHVMSREDMLLAACVNLCRKRYRQLKGMMAIHELMGGPVAIDWEALSRAARACGAARIVYAALTMTGLVLGGRAPEAALDALGVGRGRRWAIGRLDRFLRARLFHIPSVPREVKNVELASRLLRMVTYSGSQVWREVIGLKRLKRVRTIMAQDAADSRSAAAPAVLVVPRSE